MTKLLDRLETFFACCIVLLMVGGLPLFLFIHAVSTVCPY